jgi:lysophospholipase L1-like esterase
MVAVGDSKSSSLEWQSDLTAITGSPIATLADGGLTADIVANSYIDDFVAQLESSGFSLPRYALINLGANDITWDPAPTEGEWKADMLHISDVLHDAFPNIKILIMRIWRRGHAAECDTYAGWIADLATTYSYIENGPDERVFLENGDDGVTYTYDGKHPNAAGYLLTAQEWLAVVDSLGR